MAVSWIEEGKKKIAERDTLKENKNIREAWIEDIERKIAERDTLKQKEQDVSAVDSLISIEPSISVDSLIAIGQDAPIQQNNSIPQKEAVIQVIPDCLALNIGFDFSLIIGIDKENSYIKLYQGEELRGKWSKKREQIVWQNATILADILKTLKSLNKKQGLEIGKNERIRKELSLNSGRLEEIIAKNRSFRSLYGVYAHNTQNNINTLSNPITEFIENGRSKEKFAGVSITAKKATDATIVRDEDKDVPKKHYFSFAFPMKHGLIIIYDDKTQEIIPKSEFSKYGITSMPVIHDELRWETEDMINWLDGFNPKVDVKKLFDDIVFQYETYIDFTQKEMSKVHALWDFHTMIFKIFSATPYVNLNGIKGCGKSKVMQLSMLMSLNGFSIVNTSPSALFRIVDYLKPTLYIDEAEKFYGNKKNTSEDTDSIKSMLNAGFMQGAKVIRSDKNEPSILESFDVFCPKMFASINGLDGALNDRCISEIMVRTKDDGRGDLWAVEGKEFKQIRNRLYAWALENWGLIKLYYDTCHKDFKISNRDWLIWKPLLSIAYSISEDLYNEIGHFAEKYINEKRDEDEESWEKKISFALLELTRSKVEMNCYIRDIRALMSSNSEMGEELPSSSFIGRFINKIGLKQYKIRGKNNYYKLTRENVIDIIGRHYEIPEEYFPAKEEVITIEKKPETWEFGVKTNDN